MRHFAAPLVTFFALIGVALLAASCGENGGTIAGTSDQQVPGLMPGSPADGGLSDPTLANLTAEDRAALADAGAAGKANQSCSTLWGWFYSSDTSPPYWYSYGPVNGGECVQVTTGYTWKMRLLIRNDTGDEETYKLTGPGGSIDATVDAGQVWSWGWTNSYKGTFKVEPQGDSGRSFVAFHITETWRSTD